MQNAKCKMQKESRKIPIHEEMKQEFRSRLLDWYRRNGRDLPWRRTSDAYKILVSEIMLQQTQVERVLPKYEEFLQKYPTMRDLAGASPEEVKETWRPLGYNIRPERLQSIAREVVERYGGEIPSNREELLALDGIGEYTAGAVLSFAFGQDAPILDTNVMRVLSRVFFGQDAEKKGKIQKRLWKLAEELIPKGNAYDFNQALMDFGALVCTARKPICLLCPMNTICRACPYEKSVNEPADG
jgi:A/G-specific adenine glycosylase